MNRRAGTQPARRQEKPPGKPALAPREVHESVGRVPGGREGAVTAVTWLHVLTLNMSLASAALAGSPQSRPRLLQRGRYGGRMGPDSSARKWAAGRVVVVQPIQFCEDLVRKPGAGNDVTKPQRVAPHASDELKPRLPEAPPLRRRLLGGQKAPAPCRRHMGARIGRLPAPPGAENRLSPR